MPQGLLSTEPSFLLFLDASPPPGLGPSAVGTHSVESASREGPITGTLAGLQPEEGPNRSALKRPEACGSWLLERRRRYQGLVDRVPLVGRTLASRDGLGPNDWPAAQGRILRFPYAR